jgi:sugar phosphate isomerase/epimerase
MIKIGGRVGFDRFNEMEPHFKSIDFPVELALPWKYQEYWVPIEKKLDKVIAFFKQSPVEILSIHATQGRISEESFLSWGSQTLELARELGVTDITIHPNLIKGDREFQQMATLRMIKRMGGEELFSIETFSGYRRLFTPQEIMDQDLPMTLDIAHIHDQDFVMEIIERHHRKIKTVHLSAVGEGEHHLPINDFCISVVARLKELNWSGPVQLEYLPWHHYRVREDIQALRQYLATGQEPKLLPVSDHFRNQPIHYGYRRDGS